MITHGFTKQGAKRIVDAVRTVEANDPLYAGQKIRRQRPGVGAEAFIVGKITSVDNDNNDASVTEQYWGGSDMDDLPGGRVWDGAAGNLPRVQLIDGVERAEGNLVVLGFRHGADGAGVWYASPVPPSSGGVFTTYEYLVKVEDSASTGINVVDTSLNLAGSFVHLGSAEVPVTVASEDYGDLFENGDDRWVKVELDATASVGLFRSIHSSGFPVADVGTYYPDASTARIALDIRSAPPSGTAFYYPITLIVGESGISPTLTIS